jgi:hypothetical protein
MIDRPDPNDEPSNATEITAMTDTQDTELNALLTLLDTLGADRARWPTGAEARFAELIASNPHARRALAEAQALERTLDLAPRVIASRQAALTRQIMAQTRSSTGAPLSNVVPMRAPQKPAPSRQFTQGFGLMAAALLLGIIVGVGGIVSPVLDSLAEAVGITDDSSELAYATDLLPGGEDTL